MDLRPSSSFRELSNSIPKRCCSSLSCIQMEDLALPFFFFWLHHAACGILVPPPGSVLAPSAAEARGLNCWTARKSLTLIFKINSCHYTLPCVKQVAGGKLLYIAPWWPGLGGWGWLGERSKREGIYVSTELSSLIVQQKPTLHCIAVILQ